MSWAGADGAGGDGRRRLFHRLVVVQRQSQARATERASVSGQASEGWPPRKLIDCRFSNRSSAKTSGCFDFVSISYKTFDEKCLKAPETRLRRCR